MKFINVALADRLKKTTIFINKIRILFYALMQISHSSTARCEENCIY